MCGCQNQTQIIVPSDVRSVKGLWVYSEGSSLRIRWDRDFSAVNVSEFAIEWSAVTNPIRKHWQRVDGSTFTARLTGQRLIWDYKTCLHTTVLMSQTCLAHIQTINRNK